MTKSEILDDIAYVKSMAEEGRTAPLLGGRIGLMWGVLLSLTFLAHWAVVSGVAGMPQQSLGWVWLTYAIVGAVGSVLLGRSIDRKPGASSVGNRTENAVWVSFVIMMAACFFGMVANMIVSGSTPQMFDTMVCIGFAGQIIAYLTIATVSGQKALKIPGLLAIPATIVSFALLGKPELYLAATVGIVLTVVLPSLGQIKREPKEIV